MSSIVCLLIACGSVRSADAPPTANLRGLVTIGPSCPVETAESPCPDTPFHGTVRARSGDVTKQAQTDTEGRFEMALPPGTYRVVAIVDGGGLPFAKPQTVHVPADGISSVHLLVDSGIR